MGDYEWQDRDLESIYYAITEQTAVIREFIKRMEPQPRFRVGDVVVPYTGSIPQRVIAVRPDAQWKFVCTLYDGTEWSEHNLGAAS